MTKGNCVYKHRDEIDFANRKENEHVNYEDEKTFVRNKRLDYRHQCGQTHVSGIEMEGRDLSKKIILFSFFIDGFVQYKKNLQKKGCICKQKEFLNQITVMSSFCFDSHDMIAFIFHLFQWNTIKKTLQARTKKTTERFL
ncbi:hypothetical protein RFI_24075 [Reticulomyxa filosa]|uniref:Uncharacterized protein n=1 Tax=Reticulomyxa filosa TaxID=46433 RepID=X6MJR1_RETFI|nr:hypothetical protein RFI_24075 [Reticulomyxa filosa]|eukprot:ETO13300.1 hypothetical protein RFI_24075 [Reticulomyxa filosa]